MEKIKSNFIYKYLIILLLIFAYFLMFFNGANALNWVDRQFPGFSMYSNLLVSDVSLPNWTGTNAGIKPFDKVVQVDGKIVSNTQEIYNYSRSVPIGTDVNYKILRGDKFIDLEIPTMKLNLNDFLSLFVQFIVGIAFIIIATFVIYFKPDLISSKIFVLFSLSMGIWFISDINTIFVHKHNIALIAQFILPATIINLSFVFPTRIAKRKKFNYVWISYIISLILIGIQLFQFPLASNLWVFVYKLNWVYTLLAGIIFLSLTSKAYFRPESFLEKKRAQVILIGSFLGLIIPAILALGFLFFEISGTTILAIPVVFFPLSIAYAIIKHKLFDIQVIMQKALVYGFSSGAVAALFILPLFLLNLKFSTENLWKNPAYLLVLSIVVILVVNPLQNLVQRFVDTLFFRKKYDYATTITKFSDKLSSLLSISEISNELIYTISKTLFVEKGYLFVNDKDTGSYKLSSSIPPDKFNIEQGESQTFDGGNSLVELLYQNKKEIFVEDVISENQYAQKRIDLLKTYADFNASLIVPLFFKSDLLGILILANKKSGQLFTTEDLNFIRTITNQVAISLENSFSFELVQDYADEVEEKNKQLKNVQAQLIQSEKMSAIGHLASGIAHEIRNPLNIIEGARYYLSSLFTNGSENNIAQEYLEYIQNEVIRTNRLIDSLLDFSKFQESNIEDININNVVENVLILSRKLFSDSNIKIKKNLEEKLPTLKGDSNQLWQVVINLLMNSVQAIKSIPEINGEGEIVIETGIYSKPDSNYLEHLYFKVMDNGCGIKEKDLSSIFDPFFTNKPDGTGLGLSVSYKIIEAHSGSMLVSSEVGIGTSFMVELPVVNQFSGEVVNGQKENINS